MVDCPRSVLPRMNRHIMAQRVFLDETMCGGTPAFILGGASTAAKQQRQPESYSRDSRTLWNEGILSEENESSLLSEQVSKEGGSSLLLLAVRDERILPDPRLGAPRRL